MTASRPPVLHILSGRIAAGPSPLAVQLAATPGPVLINQLRQKDLGIERYIWRSQDDAKVRDSHAEYDDQMFRWDEPPAGGHPGQAHNCRCYAEPVSLDVPTDVTLVDYVPTDGGYPL